MGEATAEMAAADAGRGYLAAEIHRPGLANLVAMVHERGLTNVRVVDRDALELVRDRLAPGQPGRDARLLPRPVAEGAPPQAPADRAGAGRAARVATAPGRHVALRYGPPRLRPGDAADAHGERGCVNAYPRFAPRPDHRPETKFERRGIEAGRQIFDLVFHRR